MFALAQLGYQKLRKEQVKVLNAFVGGRDVFSALPIGYGKSLCFTLLPLIGGMACPAALDNLRRSLLSLTLLQQQHIWCRHPSSVHPRGFDTPTLRLHIITCHKFLRYTHI